MFRLVLLRFLVRFPYHLRFIPKFCPIRIALLNILNISQRPQAVQFFSDE